MSIRFGADAVHDLEVVLAEGLDAARVVVGGLDRRDAVAARAYLEVARRGAFVAIDHVGSDDDEHLTDAERVTLVAELVDAGHLDRILLSSSATGVAKGHVGNVVPFSRVLTELVPALRAHGIGEDAIRHILTHNPSELLAVRS